MEGFFLLFFFLLGFIFRLWFIDLVPQPFVFDQVVYEYIASSIRTHLLYVDRFRTYGYPLIMAIVGLMGKSAVIWKMFQACLDTAVAILIYLTGKKIFGGKRPAVFSGLLYLFNPYTSAYTGVFLTETTTIFMMTLVFFLFAIFLKYKKLAVLLLLSFVLGYLAQVRSEFFFFCVFSLLFIIWIYWKIPFPSAKKLSSMILAVFIFLSAFIYQIIGNLTYFKEFSLMTVDNAFVKELYISTQLNRRLSTDTGRIDQYPFSVEKIYDEFSLPDTPSGRKQMTKKYWNLTIGEIQRNPGRFFFSRIEKFWYVWEKHNIFLYKIEPVSSWIKTAVYWGNISLLAAGLFGLAIWRQSVEKNLYIKYLYLYRLTIFLFAYITVIYSFSTTYERYSISAYPLIFLFTGYAISFFTDKLITIKHK